MTESTTEIPTNGSQRTRKIALLSLACLFILIAVLWLLYWLIWGRFEVYTDDAYVNGNLVQLMAQIPGTVVAIHADDTQFVNQGQIIAKLDPADMEIALQHAGAVL